MSKNPHRIVADATGAVDQTGHNQPTAPRASVQPPGTTLEFALRYRSLGFYIFPIRRFRYLADGKPACSCNAGMRCLSIDKHPAVRWKTEATCDEATVRDWWTGRFAGCGIGCAAGPSNLAVFDLDGPTGLKTFQELLQSTEWPPTPRSKTARGWHVFFKAPEGGVPTWSNSKTKLDVRGVGGLAVLPPSPHASGHVYTWEVAP
jgi:Bifunctional DNA primase/polymerase, N-terminal